MSFRFYQFFICLSITSFIQCAPPNQRNDQINKSNRTSDVVANRPDHLKAIPLERDGELNKEFRRELLAGNNHQATGNQDSDDAVAKQVITEIFEQADKDKDGRLSRDELKTQIQENTKKHLAEGRNESEQLFQRVDENGDGLVTWHEYKVYFMIENDMDDEKHVKRQVDEHSNNVDRKSHIKLIDEHRAFKQADADEDGLDETEWLGFQHPENSRTMLTEMTNEILRSFDRNNDGLLTVEEFVHPPEDVADKTQINSEYVEARRYEFENVIDTDKNGEATNDELRNYVDPLNEYHVVGEVQKILDFADKDKNSFLTLSELLDCAEILISSPFIHTHVRLHDDL